MSLDVLLSMLFAALLMILGWTLGVLSGIIVPEELRKRKEKRELDVFKKQLKLEIKNLRDLIVSEIQTFETYFEIDSSSTESDLVFSMGKRNSPLSLGGNFRCETFRSNLKYLVSVEENIQEKINKFYNIIVDTLNSVSPTYEKIPDNSQGVKDELIHSYYDTLKRALDEVEEILSDFSRL